MATRYPILDTVRTALTSTAVGRAVLAAADEAAAREAIGAIGAIGVTTTTYYASNGTAANGTAPATAAITGTGSASTVDFAVGSAARNLNSSTVTCGTWVSPTVPQTAKRITLYIRSTALSGLNTSGFRYLQASLRRAAESPPASILLGLGVTDANGFYSGNCRTGSNGATYNLGTVTNGSPLNGTDRWIRVIWELEDNGPRMRIATGATTGSTRPTQWAPVNLDTQTQSDSRTNLGTLGTADAQVILGFESYATGGSTSTMSLSLTMEVQT